MLDSFFWGKNRSIKPHGLTPGQRRDWTGRRRPFRFGPYREGDKVPGIQEHAMGAKAERGHLRLEWVRQTVARLIKNMGACIQEGHSLCINRATTRQDSVGYVVQGLGKE